MREIEKFQMIYIGFSPSRRWIITCHSLSDLSPKSSVERGRNLTNTTSARWPMLTSTVIHHVSSIYTWYDAMWHYTSVIFLWRHVLQNTWQILLKTVKTKESLRSCHRWEEPKETRKLNVMWRPIGVPGTRKDIRLKLRKSDYRMDFSY